MKIDPHVHSKGMSLCSHVGYKEIIDEKKKAGYNAVMLTNHCQPWYYEKGEQLLWTNKFLSEYWQAKEYGDACGIKVLLGIEVSVSVPHWSDFLLYGVNEGFLYRAKSLYELTQAELFDYCERNNVLMVQAHPFREEYAPAKPEYMHGFEINLRPSDFEKRKDVEEFALKHNLFVTCGSDYHSVSEKEFGGMILPDDVCSSEDMFKCITSSKSTTLFFEDEVKTYFKK